MFSRAPIESQIGFTIEQVFPLRNLMMGLLMPLIYEDMIETQKKL